MTLGEREYLSVGQAARIFGHGAEFWRERFDAGDVEGYRHGTRRDRKLRVDSIRAYLAALEAADQPAEQRGVWLGLRERMRRWAEKREPTQGSNPESAQNYQTTERIVPWQ